MNIVVKKQNFSSVKVTGVINKEDIIDLMANKGIGDFFWVNYVRPKMTWTLLMHKTDYIKGVRLWGTSNGGCPVQPVISSSKIRLTKGVSGPVDQKENINGCLAGYNGWGKGLVLNGLTIPTLPDILDNWSERYWAETVGGGIVKFWWRIRERYNS